MKKSDVVKKVMRNLEVPKEKSWNSMTIRKQFFYFWRPNNYRREIVVEETSNSGGKSTIAVTTGGQLNSHTKILTVKNYFPNITLQLAKRKLTAIWSQNIIFGEKEVFLVQGDSSDEIQNFIDFKIREITDLIDRALSHFVEKFSYRVVGSPVWKRHENWLRGEDFIDKIPREVIIHAKGFKKVYQDGVEFIGDTGVDPSVGIKRYISNRLAEDFRVDYSDVRAWAEDHIKVLDDVFCHESFICEMSVKNRYVLTEWLFERFGGFKFD